MAASRPWLPRARDGHRQFDLAGLFKGQPTLTIARQQRLFQFHEHQVDCAGASSTVGPGGIGRPRSKFAHLHHVALHLHVMISPRARWPRR